ncbi:MAG: hypothetical protein ACM3QS_08255 [Bacteroidota bacterium]
MPLPYVLTIVLYVFVALLSAADASLVSMSFLQPFLALRWVRVHFITLGVVSQAVFGLLPGLVASLSKKPRPAMRWDIWLSLNAGLISLVAGFAGMVLPMIFAGGTLIFTAATLLLFELWRARGGEAPASLKYYLAGIFYLLVGIIIGTGLFLNWSPALHIKVPLEAHIHANSWGFMSLVFAGLLMDFIPMITGRSLGTRRDAALIFWGMTLGALGLVLGPWLGGNVPLIVFGLVVHLAATAWLLILVFRAFRAAGRLRDPGAWHLIASYLWILAPVLFAPLTLAHILQAAPIEATAPQALIYGWVLQFAIALIPYMTRRLFLKQENARLGGSWVSLWAATLGSLLVWASIFILPVQGIMYGVGFALYMLAIAVLLIELVQIAREALKKFELASARD